MKLSYMLSFRHIFKIPGMMSVMKDWQAFTRTLFLCAAYESGLLQALAHGPCTRQALIEKLEAKRPELLDALLDVGLAVKELALKGAQYALKGKRSRAVASPKGDFVAAVIQANVGYYCEAYRHAPARIRGAELGEDLEEIGDVVARFSKGIEPIIADYIKVIVSGKKSLRILDVGCGSGFFLRSAHKVNSNVTGLGLEIDPAVVKQAWDNIANWGLTDRFSIVQGDIRHPPEELTGQFDLINLSSMLYYFAEDERAQLLSDMRSRLTLSGMLSVVLNFNSQGKDLAAANLNLVNCSLKGLHQLPSLDQVCETLRQCGFKQIETHKFLPASTFMGITARV